METLTRQFRSSGPLLASFTLYRLPTVRTDCSVVTLMQRLPLQAFSRSCAGDEKGQRLSRSALQTQLDGAVIAILTRVMGSEYAHARRAGSLPVGSRLPYRRFL